MIRRGGQAHGSSRLHLGVASMLGVWLLAVAPAPGAESHIPPNPGSHDAALLTELLAGRVVVMKRPSRSRKWDVNNVATFFYRDASGAEVGCNPYGEWRGHWVVIGDSGPLRSRFRCIEITIPVD